MPVRRSSFPLFFIITPLLVAAAVLLRRYSGKAPDDAVYGYVFDVLRSLIYIGLLMAWYFSIRRRIMQPLARRCLCALALLLLFFVVWPIIRGRRKEKEAAAK